MALIRQHLDIKPLVFLQSKLMLERDTDVVKQLHSANKSRNYPQGTGGSCDKSDREMIKKLVMLLAEMQAKLRVEYNGLGKKVDMAGQFQLQLLKMKQAD